MNQQGRSTIGLLIVCIFLVAVIFITQISNATFLRPLCLYASSEDVSTTTEMDYQSKLLYTTPILPSGEYRIIWYAEATNSDNNCQVRVKVLAGGDIAARSVFEPEPENTFFSMAGFYHHVLETSGTFAVRILYHAMSGGIAKIQRARIEILKIN